ncbi:cysteine synthase A [Clostridiales bacterium COT073_COT-073]|nr:cysteine synthase A [Clostridiales bacterium COT073_COT-073]
MNIINQMTDLVGRTPIVRLHRMAEKHGLSAALYVKLESANPGGSVKDRIALNMIENAEKEGQLKPGALLVEATSGNTGIGLAWIGAVKGYSVVLTMPESMSIERRKLLAAYGAKLVLTPAKEGMKGAVAKAREILAENPNSFMPGQFQNPANPDAHRKTTAQEILRDMDKQVDVFVAGVGTGGTITGVGEILKAELPAVKVFAVEPIDSPVLSGGNPGPHKIQGIGAGFMPDTLNVKIYDEVIQVQYEDARQTARELAEKEGILAGVSSAANVFAAMQIAKRPELAGKNILTIICDTGERYLSAELFS